jgi:hypothetical protein
VPSVVDSPWPSTPDVSDNDRCCRSAEHVCHEGPSCRQVVWRGLEKGITARANRVGVERVPVLGEAGPAVKHGGRSERRYGVLVRNVDGGSASLALPPVQHMGGRIWAVLKGHLLAQLPEIHTRIPGAGGLPIDQRDTDVCGPQHVAAMHVTVDEHRFLQGRADRPDPLVGQL